MDFDAVNQIVDLMGNATDKGFKFVQGWQAVSELLNSSKAGTDPDVKAAIANLTLQVANSESARADLTMTLVSLKGALADLQAHYSDLERYELWETPSGSLVYRLKGLANEGQPLHYLCPHCVEAKRKSILQGDRYSKTCHPCGAAFDFDVRHTHERTPIVVA